MIIRLFALLLAAAGGVGLFWFRRRRQPVAYPAAADYIVNPTVELEVARQPDGVLALHLHDQPRPRHIYAGTRPDTIDRSQPVRWQAADANTLLLPDLDPALHYFFEVAFPDGAAVLTTAQRIIPFEGIANFRDVGGYRTADGRRVRWGQVYRAGAFASPTEADLAKIDALRLRLVCDLRSDEEVAEAPDRLPETTPPRYLHLPLQASDETMKRLRAILFNRRAIQQIVPDTYRRVMLEQNAALYGRVLTELADPANYPAVIHCTAGKDRTGIAVALLLLLLGVPKPTVIADYTLSNHYYDVFARFAAKAVRPLLPLGVRLGDLHPLLVATSETMQLTIDYLDTTYGSAEGYLRERAGLDDATIAALRAQLLV